MTLFAGFALFAVATAPDVTGAVPMVFAQVTVRQRVIIRVPRITAAAAMPTTLRGAPRLAAPITWQEKSGPRCVPISSLAGAQLTRRESVDLVLVGGKRVRARLDDDCPSLDFYRGFYVKPNRDGMICADRDEIRNRAGGACEIDSFRRLVPKR